jgi:mannosyltransferase
VGSSRRRSYLAFSAAFNAPFYVLMHGWCSVFGTSTLAIRLPWLVCASAAVGLHARPVRRLAGDGAGLTAGLLAASGPLFARQAIQARP